jgi:hypothetical protein
MAAPTTLTVTYTGGSGSPQTIALPKPDGTNPQEFTLAVRNAFLNGGFWVVIAGVNSFIPWGQVTSISAQ